MIELLTKDVEEIVGKKIRKDAISIGVDVAEHYSGIAILRTDNTKIYIESLQKITTNDKEDIMNRMEYFIIALDKFKQELKKYSKEVHELFDPVWKGEQEKAKAKAAAC